METRTYLTYLDNADIGFLSRFVDWDFRYPFYPVLNSSGYVGNNLTFLSKYTIILDMRTHLHGLPQVVTTTLNGIF